MTDDDRPVFDPAALGDLTSLMGNVMGQVQQMQSRMRQVREQLRDRTIEGHAGGGIVTVTANGAGEVVRVTIDPVAVDPRDVPMLEDLLAAATNDALARAREMMRQELGQITGGIDIPGLSDLL
jgi:hypothetical protein